MNFLHSKRYFCSIIIAIVAFFSSFHALADAQSDFFRAIDKDSLTLATQAIKDGANPNQPNPQGYTALMIAAQTDNLRLTRYLLELKADPNIRNSVGETAVMLASYYGRTEMVKQLHLHGAKIDHPGWNPLIYAATNGFLHVLQYLLDEKVDINSTSPNGTTALMMAVRSNHLDAAELLLKRGANVNIRNENGENALYWADKAGYISVVSLLKEYGATQ